MSGFGLSPEAPRGADYVLAALAWIVLAGLIYLLGFVITLVVVLQLVYDPMTDDPSDVASAAIPLFAVSALLAGLVGTWVAARLVLRKRATDRSVWLLVVGIAGLGVILLVIGLLATLPSMMAQVVALVVGAAGGGFLALKRKDV